MGFIENGKNNGIYDPSTGNTFDNLSDMNRYFDLVNNKRYGGSVNPALDNNRFDALSVPGTERELTLLDRLFNTNLDALNRNYGSDAATIQRQATERMASQGVNKGSFFNNMVNNSTDNLNKSKYNALSGLLSNKLGQDINVYDKFWNRLFAKTKAAQSTDFGIEDYKLKNKQYELQKRLTDDKLNQSPGFLDDIFSALGLGAQIAGIPAGAEGESILQLLLAL